MAKQIQARLLELQDLGYREFHSKLMPTVAKEKIIGIRTPVLRQFAKELTAEEKAEFLQQLPHTYYEENNLHGILLMELKDFALCLREIERFLPEIDNWATCDMTKPKVFRKHLPELSGKIDQWLHSSETYTIRFGISMLMSFYLEDGVFKPEHLAKVAAVESEEYYVRMMVAWYFATALAKQYEAVLPYLVEHRLEPWTHRKAIQKAIESRRISEATKDYLRSLR